MRIEIYGKHWTHVHQIKGDSYSFDLKENSVYNIRFISLDLLSESNKEYSGIPNAKLLYINIGSTGSFKNPMNNLFKVKIDFSKDLHYSFFWKANQQTYSIVTYGISSFIDIYNKCAQA